MYSYFIGQITQVCATHITLECNNIGYLIKVPNPYQYQINTNIKLFVYLLLKENSNELYGFLNEEEKSIFINLIKIKKVGPKTALSILASTNIQEIYTAVYKNNISFFESFSGIGPKLSQQIVISLRKEFKIKNTTTNKHSNNYNNICIALKSLGYSKQEIENVISKINISDNTSLADAIKEALKMLNNT